MIKNPTPLFPILLCAALGSSTASFGAEPRETLAIAKATRSEARLFAAGELLTEPEDHAPANVSRFFVKTVVPSGKTARVEIPAGGASDLIVWTVPLTGAAADANGKNRNLQRAQPAQATTLRTPQGRVLTQGALGSRDLGVRRFSLEDLRVAELGLELPHGQEVLHVAEAEEGAHVLSIETASDEAAVTVIAAEPKSPLSLSTWVAPLSRKPGEPVFLHAELSDGGVAVAGARLFARLASPGGAATHEITLFDDGRHDDGAAGDGIYGARFDGLNPEAPAGFWTARFDAEGRDTRGLAFLRTSSGGFMNEPELAHLDASSIETRVVGEGTERRMAVTARATVLVPGDYRFDVLVAKAQSKDGSREGVGWGESTVRLEKGETRLAIEVPIGAAQDTLRADIRLLGLEPMGVAGRATREIRVAGPVEREGEKAR